jgi:hypothetical protein
LLEMGLQLDNSTKYKIHEQDHHRDPTLILLLTPRTLTWSSLQGSHTGLGDPRQLARPSPLREGAPLFAAPRLWMTNELMCGSWPRGSEWRQGQSGARLGPKVGWTGWPGPTSAHPAASFGGVASRAL